MDPASQLQEMARSCRERQTTGLPAETVASFLSRDPRLGEAIASAYDSYQAWKREQPDLLKLPEAELVAALQEGYVNFYAPDTVNPYVALGAKGPWLITSGGAVIHDSGGYGMLGLGHNPDSVAEVLKRPEPMANIMTANRQQWEFQKRLRQEIGYRRSDNPLPNTICLNSGSEAMTIAMRIADVHAHFMLTGRYRGCERRYITAVGSFHGRTDRPARLSDNSLAGYQQHLASFQDREFTFTVPPNDTAALREAFARAEASNTYIEAVVLEPVMGEGNPGMAITPEFYAAARELTEKHGTFLVIDSIQAALRAQGCLSIVDYPGFETLPPPDMETYSKALNAGQYPLSVLGLGDVAAQTYRSGIYGNTMTTNPRALAIGCAVLDGVTPELRQNIQQQGQNFVRQFERLAARFPDLVTGVTGTGLLFALALNPDKIEVVGTAGAETFLRRNGIGVIHGGVNSLRFTPVFDITGAEVDLVVGGVARCLEHFASESSWTGTSSSMEASPA